jgi:phage terminase large subunit-like protein
VRAGPKPQPAAATLPALKATAPAKRVLEFFRTHLRHTAGAKAGQPLRLVPWQRHEIIEPLFGTLRRDGLRQYRTAFVTLPRRNGKSVLGAAIGLYLLAADNEPGAQVVSAAANREQARVVFDQAAKMVEASPSLSALCQVYRSEIVIPSTGSRYKVVSRDAPVQHGMNLHGAVIDELHAHRDPDLYRVLTSSTGSRRQPLTFIITTAGTDPHSIAAEVHRYSQQVLAGVIEDPSWLAVIYAAPADADPWAEATWRACNPALRSGFRSLDELRTAALQAKEVPAREAPFRQLYLNQWGTTAASRWLSMTSWDACAILPRDPASLYMRAAEAANDGSTTSGGSLRGRRAFIGLDLAATTDLTALVILVPDADGSYDVRAEFWCPADTLAARSRQDRVPYELWAQQGYLTATPGNSVDYSAIEARLHVLMAQYDVAEVAVDPWNARGLTAKLQQDGVPAVEVAQTMANLTSASKALEQMVLSRQIRHDGHPVLRWNVSNVVADVDGNGNLKPSKKRSHERIDGVSAMVTGLSRALVGQQAGSIYDVRGLVVV